MEKENTKSQKIPCFSLF